MLKGVVSDGSREVLTALSLYGLHVALSGVQSLSPHDFATAKSANCMKREREGAWYCYQVTLFSKDEAIG